MERRKIILGLGATAQTQQVPQQSPQQVPTPVQTLPSSPQQPPPEQRQQTPLEELLRALLSAPENIRTALLRVIAKSADELIAVLEEEIRKREQEIQRLKTILELLRRFKT